MIVVAALAGAGGGYLAGRSTQPVVSGLNAPSSDRLSQVSVAESLAMIDAVKKVDPAVVTIIATGSGSNVFGQSSEAIGTGIIFDSAGDILTNNHVVQGASKYTVVLASGGKPIDAKLRGADGVSDLAVLQLGTSATAFAQFGNSKDLQPGQQVLAIGSPLGLDLRNTVTAGIISALHRTISDSSGELDDVIQTDAPINQGNSGGPLIDLSGQVVGINTAKGSSPTTGIGFAIPIDLARNIASQILKTGHASHPFLGVTMRAVNSQVQAAQSLSVDHGAYILNVQAGSPADKAGLQTGDVIVAVDSQEIDADHTLLATLSTHNPGDKVKLSYVRGSGRHTAEATLVQRPSGT
jgi:2-alkenal reductase